MSITVIDSIMGSGKSSWAIQHMKDNPETSFIYVTPTLTEIQRVIQEVSEPGRKVIEPLNRGKGKKESLKKLLAQGCDIACTHELFKAIDPEVVSLIADGEYELIIDEAMNVFNVQKLSKQDDLQVMTRAGLCSVDDNDYIAWSDDKVEWSTVYDEWRDLSIMKSLMYVDARNLIWKYPADVFRACKDVYVLTYMFEASSMYPYFHLENLCYEKKMIYPQGGRLALGEFHPAKTSQYRNLICIYDGKMNDIGQKKTALSQSWFMNADKNSLSQMKRNLDNYYRNITNSKSSEFLWTCYKVGWTKVRGKASKNNFLYCNARGTNDYADRYNLAYTVNRYIQPAEKKFYKRHGLEFDGNLWALSNLLQWIWRSRIRRGEYVNLYIPSSRMRALLVDWMSEKCSGINP